MYSFLVCEHMFSFLLGIYLVVELVRPMVTLYKVLRNCQTFFQSDCTMLHFLPVACETSGFATPFVDTCYYLTF